jgi:hypothetical protein
MKTRLLFLHFCLYFFYSCGLSDFSANNRNTKECIENPGLSQCLKGDILGPNDPYPGSVSEGGYQTSDNPSAIPVKFVFLNSVSETLSSNPTNDAQIAISKLNQAMTLDEHPNTDESHQYLKFELSSAVETIDMEYHNTQCNLDVLGSLAAKYGSAGEMVIVVVNFLDSTCSGMAPIGVLPKHIASLGMVEYGDPFENNIWTPLVHEVTHMLGFFHTMYTAHKLGLELWNNRFDEGIVVDTNLKCDKKFYYYIHDGDYVSGFVYVDETQLRWDPMNNLMLHYYSEESEVPSLFTSGYKYSNSYALDCYHEHHSNSL